MGDVIPFPAPEPKGYIEVPMPLDPDDLADLKRRWEAQPKPCGACDDPADPDPCCLWCGGKGYTTGTPLGILNPGTDEP